jgi:predicted permease
MNTLILRFTEGILPIAIAVLAGFTFQRLKPIDSRPLTQIVLYLMFPAFIFHDVYYSQLPFSESLQMILLSIALVIVMFGLGYFSGRAAGLQRTEILALALTTAFMNAGNFGLAVAEMSFGEEGVAWASIFFLTCVILNNAVVVYVAELGRGTAYRALIEVVKIPALYAILAAVLANAFGLEVPQLIMEPLDLLGRGAIPVMLIVLGMQIADSGIPSRWGVISISTTLRLIVAPLIAFGMSLLLGWQGMLRDIGILQAGMPGAVLNGVLAAEYDLEPDLVASTILVSTLLSPLTLTIILTLLKN